MTPTLQRAAVRCKRERVRPFLGLPPVPSRHRSPPSATSHRFGPEGGRGVDTYAEMAEPALGGGRAYRNPAADRPPTANRAQTPQRTTQARGGHPAPGPPKGRAGPTQGPQGRAWRPGPALRRRWPARGRVRRAARLLSPGRLRRASALQVHCKCTAPWLELEHRPTSRPTPPPRARQQARPTLDRTPPPPTADRPRPSRPPVARSPAAPPPICPTPSPPGRCGRRLEPGRRPPQPAPAPRRAAPTGRQAERVPTAGPCGAHPRSSYGPAERLRPDRSCVCPYWGCEHP